MSSEQSTGNLVSEALARISSLVRGEFDLARTEINENVASAAAALGMIVGAVVVALTALNVLAAALVAALGEMGIPGEWSALIVGAVFGIIAYVMLQKGMADLKLTSLAPTRAAANVKRDANVVKESLNG